jgi:hypothetical protein
MKPYNKFLWCLIGEPNLPNVGNISYRKDLEGNSRFSESLLNQSLDLKSIRHCERNTLKKLCFESFDFNSIVEIIPCERWLS